MHDNHYGAITALTATFDDQYVLSGGADGNVFVYEANLPTAAERAEAMTVTVSYSIIYIPPPFLYCMFDKNVDSSSN